MRYGLTSRGLLMVVVPVGLALCSVAAIAQNPGGGNGSGGSVLGKIMPSPGRGEGLPNYGLDGFKAGYGSGSGLDSRQGAGTGSGRISGSGLSAGPSIVTGPGLSAGPSIVTGPGSSAGQGIISIPVPGGGQQHLLGSSAPSAGGSRGAGFSNSGFINGAGPSVPEPGSTALLVGLVLAGGRIVRRRRRKA